MVRNIGSVVIMAYEGNDLLFAGSVVLSCTNTLLNTVVYQYINYMYLSYEFTDLFYFLDT